MKKISFQEYQNLLLDMLNYINRISAKNNINYSLIGGSLIGAVREKKILSWDDDIDIILTVDNYNKLEEALINDNNSRYKLLNNKIDPNYPFPFSKLVDTKTIIEQKNQIKIDNYGAFIDIFTYHNIPDNKILRFFHLKRLDFYKKLINGLLVSNEFEKKQLFIKKIRNKFSKMIGAKKLNYKINKLSEKYDHKTCNSIISNWRAYSQEKEIQNKNSMLNYEYVSFSNLRVMITKDYDKILKTTFGDYMTPPKDSNKICHTINAYWKDENEKINE